MCRTCGCGDELHAHPSELAHGHEHASDHVHHHGNVPHHHGDGNVHHEHGPHDGAPHHRRILVEKSLLAKNDELAVALRERLTRDRIAAFNVIGAPGAGKTALLERTILGLSDLSITVIEGDQATDYDAQRIAATGCRVTQVNTGPGCHLDASMIERALAGLVPAPRSLILIENVGNLVCPALFDLGERAKVVVMSVTEGVDKPLKYPHVFRAASALVLTKTDLLPHLDVDPRAIIDNARRIRPSLEVFPVSATRGEGLGEWCGWLRRQTWSLA
jgi:hydrogenase nickel incorporation protein HypB